MESIIVDGKEYRFVTIRNRSKWIASDGDAINPYRPYIPATTHLNDDGYLCFGGGIPVHLYVAYGWLDGYTDGAEVNHKDYNRQNPSVDNLEWVSHIDNVRYSSDVGRYSNRTGEKNPNYHNTTLHEKLENNPELKIEYYSRPGIQNGRATEIYVYDSDKHFVRKFDLIKDCAQWLQDIFGKPKNICNIQSAISTAIKNNTPYKGYYFYKEMQN